MDLISGRPYQHSKLPAGEGLINKDQEVHMHQHESTRQSSSFTLLSIVLAGLTMATFFLGLLFWPTTKQFFSLTADPPTVKNLGSVIEITFVGGIEPKTQVRTDSKTVLISSAAELDPGMSVERRSTALSEQLCVAGSNRCFKILSR